jgi:hypothetical protein
VKKILCVPVLAVLACCISAPKLQSAAPPIQSSRFDMSLVAAKFDGGGPAPTCDPADPNCKIPGGLMPTLDTLAAKFDGGGPAPTCDPADPNCKIPGGLMPALDTLASKFDGGGPAPTCDPADPNCKIPGGLKMGFDAQRV